MTQNYSPKISIVVPIYNTANLLPRCLDSILTQTLKDWECILVNDGSTDNSLEVVQNYALCDSRFIVLSQENLGVSAARNKGIDRAKGKYLCFVDSDDEILPNYLVELYEAAETNQADMVVGGFREAGRNYNIPNPSATTYDTSERMLPDNFSRFVSYIGGMYRTGLLKKHSIKFEVGISLSEDELFNYDVFLVSTKVASIAHSNYVYHILDSEKKVSSLHKRSFTFQEALRLYHSYLKRLKQFRLKYANAEDVIINGSHNKFHFARLISCILSEKGDSKSHILQKFKAIPKEAVPLQQKRLTTALRYWLLSKNLNYIALLTYYNRLHLI